MAGIFKAHDIRGNYPDEVDGITCKKPGIWFNVRASNTEPVVRFIAESRDPSTLEALKKRVEKILLSD